MVAHQTPRPDLPIEALGNAPQILNECAAVRVVKQNVLIMPRVAQWLGEIIPLAHFIRLSRDTIVCGAGTGDMSGKVWAMAAFFAVFLAITAWLFRLAAGRIFAAGMLMYGKEPSWRGMWRWLR